MSSQSIPDVTSQTFAAEVLESPRPVAVKFYGEHCPPCAAFAPVVESVASEYAGRVEFRAVNVRANVDLGARYRIDSVPRMIFFNNGQPVGELRGMAASTVVARRLEELLASAAAKESAPR
jgi:thioredoxin 1